MVTAGAVGVAVMSVVPAGWISWIAPVLILGAAAVASIGSYGIWKRQRKE